MPIPGNQRIERLRESLGSVVVVLMADELREIEEAAVAVIAESARYPERMEKMTGFLWPREAVGRRASADRDH